MAFLTNDERAFLRAVSRLGYCNPFLPERIQYEREALGPDFTEAEPVWSMRVDDPERPHANVLAISDRVEALAGRMRHSLAARTRLTAEDRTLYQDAVLFLLYHRYRDHLYKPILQSPAGTGPAGSFAFYKEFHHDWQHFFGLPGLAVPQEAAPHLFACFFQMRRAFHHVFSFLIGSSMPAARLRAAVWQSIFTHDMRRYRDTLAQSMSDIVTLVTGPTGTGKELVARAIGGSQYLPFDVKTHRFAESTVHALNLSALPSTLIESELFGHRRGAFTGALQDRRGWLEICPPGGAVFLDEIGDLDASIQVKLLRVLQTRTFQRVGDTTDRRFHGKMIAATNRDLGAAMHEGRFREDFYYRLCSDVIVTPSLQEQVRDSPGVLRELILFIAQRAAGAAAEALADEVEAWMRAHLSPAYPWPGNIRELEQCVRSVLIRKAYRPPAPRPVSTREELAREFTGGTLTAEELLRRYCTLVYARTGSYEETARRLGLDRRTVKRKVDGALLPRLRDRAS